MYAFSRGAVAAAAFWLIFLSAACIGLIVALVRQRGNSGDDAIIACSAVGAIAGLIAGWHVYGRYVEYGSFVGTIVRHDYDVNTPVDEWRARIESDDQATAGVVELSGTRLRGGIGARVLVVVYEHVGSWHPDVPRERPKAKPLPEDWWS